MTAKIAYFRISDTAQDRMKLPGTFWVRLKTMGLQPAAVLRHSQLPPTVYSGESQLTTAQLFALWRSIRELGRDPALGWQGMRDIDSDQFHPALLAALNAPTYRESLERLARYKQLCGAQEFRFTQQGDEFAVEVFWPFAASETPPTLLLDAVFALVLELGRRGTHTQLTPQRLELARPEERGNGLAGYFGCPVHHGTRRNVLVLHAADLERPFVAHNEELLQMLAPQLEDQLKAVPAPRQSLPEQVRWVLRRLLSGRRPDVAVVAKELGLSERTLQRRITEAGTTFRELLNDTRRQLAQEYLADESVEIAETAFLLGYDDVTSFYRAFRSWSDTTPAEWRLTHARPATKRRSRLEA